MSGVERERSPLQAALVLAAFAAATAAVLALVHQLTRAPIAEAERARFRAALQELLPAGRYDNDPLADTRHIRDSRLGTDEPVVAYRLRQGGTPAGVIVPVVARQGYNGPIHLLVGIRADGQLGGVRVTAHRETPGLGDKIELRRSPWILSFAGRSLDAPPPAGWTVRKEGGVFDQFTGATITPRAVVHAVRDALAVFAEHREALFRQEEEA